VNLFGTSPGKNEAGDLRLQLNDQADVLCDSADPLDQLAPARAWSRARVALTVERGVCGRRRRRRSARPARAWSCARELLAVEGVAADPLDQLAPAHAWSRARVALTVERGVCGQRRHRRSTRPTRAAHSGRTGHLNSCPKKRQDSYLTVPQNQRSLVALVEYKSIDLSRDPPRRTVALICFVRRQPNGSK